MKQTEEPRIKVSRKKRIKKALRTFFLGNINSNFIMWVRRILVGLWVIIAIITAPGFIQSYKNIIATIPPGLVRDDAISALLKQVVMTLLIGPGILYIALGYGINPQTAFYRSQFGTTFQNVGFRIRKRIRIQKGND